MKKGTFIVIEGTDGSGKGTQYELLMSRLKSEGYDVAGFDFPRYESQSSYFVKKYLNGDYGDLDSVGPYKASLFYSLDRHDVAKDIKSALEAGKVVITNRFTGSNMAHQGAKFANTDERRGYFLWLDNLEFEILGIPRPDISYVLRVPAELAFEMIGKKGPRNYTDLKYDIHEKNIDYLRLSVEVYDDLCQLFPLDYHRLDCVRNSVLIHPEVIHDMLWKKVEPLLPTLEAEITTLSRPESPSPQISPYLLKTDDNNYKITAAGHEYLDGIITNTTDNVYGFYDKLGPMTIAAAMARLSRRSDDMRITILDEFIDKKDKDSALLKRVITAYGDDSVQQLAGIYIVVEGASNLLTKQIEWGRLASYLEQSTRYIYYDKKDSDGNYSYHIPPNLDSSTMKTYIDTTNEIFNNYSTIVHNLTRYITDNSKTPTNVRDNAWSAAIRAQACDAVRMVLPVSAKSTVGIYASAQALENMIMRLKASESIEARKTGCQILNEARKIMPVFFERADKSDRGGATTAYIANTYQAVSELASEYLVEPYGQYPEPVTLVRHFPINEIDLVPHMLYEHSLMSLREIKNEVDKMSIDKKMNIFDAYIGERLNRRHRPGRALEQASYTWDLVCDYGVFRDLQRHRMVNDLQWQKLSPRYGFEIPDLVEKAGLSDMYEKCFDLSISLYSNLQAAGYLYEAQYATLLGHKLRWTVTYNARQAFHIHEIRTSPQGHPAYRKLVKQMHDELSAKHPMLADAMKFVNMDEDHELTRLASERATQYKLDRLDTI